MTQLYFYNSLTRSKDAFTPIDKKNVRLYVCGPTVYDKAHIGNARPVVVFDCLFRLLREVYGADHVTYARNITDVDDKINQRAKDENIDISVLTEKTTKIFQDDMGALGALSPSVEPRATHHIADMINMIEGLIENGHAYEAQGHVLFAVKTMENYGALSGRSVDEMLAGARVEVAPFKKDAMDFVLWKPSDNDLPGWQSPWGRGRPGWHIECSAMSKAHLGEQFDIHGGGIDLIFPHHENEIAQSCCSSSHDRVANFWMHNGYLQVEGQKMSKSLGNFITVHELLKDWRGETIRLAMMSTHYRQPINWTLKGLKEADKTLDGWYSMLKGQTALPPAKISDEMLGAMGDDLNTPKAIAHLHQLKIKEASGALQDMAQLKADGQLIGLMQNTAEKWAQSNPKRASVNEADIEQKINERAKAKEEKNWALADQIRDELLADGIELKDGPEGTSWLLKN